MVENIQEVQEYMEANKDNQEVKDYVGGMFTSDRVNSFLDGEEGKKLLQPKLDGNFSKGLQSWQTNNLDKIYQERFAKENPTADPRDIELNKMKLQLDQMQKNTTRKDLTNSALKIGQEKKLPTDLVEFFIGVDEPTTIANLDKLQAIFGKHVETLVAERLKGSSYTPPKGTTIVGGTYEDLLKNADNMTSAQIAEAFSKISK